MKLSERKIVNIVKQYNPQTLLTVEIVECYHYAYNLESVREDCSDYEEEDEEDCGTK
jgi:hypothetical protein